MACPLMLCGSILTCTFEVHRLNFLEKASQEKPCSQAAECVALPPCHFPDVALEALSRLPPPARQIRETSAKPSNAHQWKKTRLDERCSLENMWSPPPNNTQVCLSGQYDFKVVSEQSCGFLLGSCWIQLCNARFSCAMNNPLPHYSSHDSEKQDWTIWA